MEEQKLCLTVNCKCGAVVAAIMLYKDKEISSEFVQTITQYSNNGGNIKIVDINETPVTLIRHTKDCLKLNNNNNL